MRALMFGLVLVALAAHPVFAQSVPPVAPAPGSPTAGQMPTCADQLAASQEQHRRVSDAADRQEVQFGEAITSAAQLRIQLRQASDRNQTLAKENADLKRAAAGK